MPTTPMLSFGPSSSFVPAVPMHRQGSNLAVSLLVVWQVNFMLSGNDVEVDDGDYHQRTALHLAASNGHIAMVRHLVLIHGANMNVLDR